MKMKNATIKKILTSLLVVAMCSASASQSPALIKKESEIKISGTSNLHNWHEVARDFSVAMNMSAGESATAIIDRIEFSCIASSITSDNSIMTKKTHEALRVEKHPEITFSSGGQSSILVRNGEFSVILTGDLTINGVKRQVAIPVQGYLSGAMLHVNGSTKIKMSDYEIKAPTALMGTLKTGDDVTVSFNLKFEIPSDNLIIKVLNN